MPNEELDLSPYFDSAKRYWKLVLVFVVLFGLIAAGVTFILKPKWQADATLLIPLQSNGASPLSAILHSEADPLEMMKGVMENHTTLAYLSSRTGIEEKKLKKIVDVQTVKDQNQVQISVADTNPKLALQMVKDLIHRLSEESEKGNLSLATLQAIEMKKDLQKRTEHLDDEEQKLAAFTAHAQAPIDPTNPFDAALRKSYDDAKYQLSISSQQIATALSSAQKMGAQSLKLPTAIPNQETLRERLVSLQYQLATETTSLGAENPQVKALEAQIEVTKDTIKSEVAKYLMAAVQGIDPALAQLWGQHVLLQYQVDYLGKIVKAEPTEALEASNLYTEVLMEQEALKYAREQYEQTKLSALVDPLQWSILTDPYVEDEPVNKKYGLYCSLGALFGLLFGSWIGIMADKKRRQGIVRQPSAPTMPSGTPVAV